MTSPRLSAPQQGETGGNCVSVSAGADCCQGGLQGPAKSGHIFMEIG